MLNIKTMFVLSISLLLCVKIFAQDTERSVKLKDLPPAVQQRAKEQSRGGKIRGFAEEIKKGETFYEMELAVNGHNKDVIMDSLGNVVAIEEEVSLSSLPAAARIALEKQASNGKIKEVESITKNNVIVAYEAEIKIGKKSLEIRVTPEGQLLLNEDDGDDDDSDDENVDLKK
jgi:hypothetical protein